MDSIFEYPSHRSYFSHKERRGADDSLSDKACDDLDCDSFFEFCDRTVSAPGKQVLFDRLRRPCARENEVLRFEELVSRLGSDPSLREKAEKPLRKLQHPDAFSIVTLLEENHPVWSSRQSLLIHIAAILPVSTGLLFWLFPSERWIFGFIAAILLNMAIHYINKMRMQRYFIAIPQLRLLFRIAATLSRIPEFLHTDPQIPETLKSCRPLLRKLRFFHFGIRAENDSSMVLFFFTELINFLTLNEVLGVSKAFRLLDSNRENIDRVFRFTGTLDLLNSVSHLRGTMEHWSHPEFGNRLELRDVRHPLVPDCIPNTLSLQGKSILLTGSNMAGKSTFIRTIGLNLLAAQTLNTTFAGSAIFPRDIELRTSMRVNDNLLEGKSYYMQEVEQLRDLIHDSAQAAPRLFLLDEIYKGTNTIERIAASKAVLSALARDNNYVIAATHDIELTRLLDDKFELYHFCEQITDNKLSFDYKLHKGMLTRRNAIRILQLAGYPEDIITEANRIAEENPG